MLRDSIATALLIGLIASFQAAGPGISSQTYSAKPSPASPASKNPGGQIGSANELVTATVQNELKAIDDDHSHWSFRVQTRKAGATETKEVVETPHGNLTRIIARNGQPLTADEQKQEDANVQRFVSDTAAQQKQRKNLDDDGKKTRELLAMLPDALTYTYAGRTDNRTKLTFKPNPNFHPPSHEATVFHAMEGQMVIDTKEHRLVEFSGHLTHPVKFGGGLLGDLQQGGTFDVRQQEAAPGHWEISLLKVNIHGKALFFKTISVQQDEQHSNFRRVPDSLTLAQAQNLVMKPQSQPAKPQSGD